MGKYNLKYKTVDQLIAEVKSDFEAYNTEGLIKPYQLIKVAKRVNYDLGLKIHQTKNIVLEVDNGRAKLPDDFMVLNYAYLLGNFEMVSPMVQGTHVEEVPLDAPTYHPGVKNIPICGTPEPCPEPEPECPDPCEDDPCATEQPCGTWINCKGEEMQLIQKVKYQTKRWTEFYRVHIDGDDQLFDASCPNKRWQSKHNGFIKDGYIYLGIRKGEIYLNYQGIMEDGEGNLLVLDHPMINEFYEYAMKERVLEILMGNGESVNGNFVSRIDMKLRFSRNNALSIVNTPDFAELKRMWKVNRQAMFNKYYKMFS